MARAGKHSRAPANRGTGGLQGGRDRSCDHEVPLFRATGEAVRPGGPLVILYADDLTGTQRRVEAAGATIVRATFAFPGGRRFHFLDPGGYELAVWWAE